MSYLLKSKENELFLSVKHQLNSDIRDFVSKIRSYFSKQQKDVIKNIKSGNVVKSRYYDLDYYVNKFLNIYKEKSNFVMKKSYNRCIAESGIKDDELFDYIKNVYFINTVEPIITVIEMNTIKKLNVYYTQYQIDKNLNEFIKKVNHYYNDYCKGFRAKTISRTEVYRMYNYFYMSYMGAKNFIYKKWIAGKRPKTSKVKELDGQVKFILEEFVTSSGLHCLYPPIHPNDYSILLNITKKI